MRPLYYREKLEPGVYKIHDHGYVFLEEHGVLKMEAKCGHWAREDDIEEDGSCPDCWSENHLCAQCGEFELELHEGDDGLKYCPKCYIEYLEEQLQRRNGMDLNEFVTWQKEKPTQRQVEIKIQNPETTIWVYDFDFMVGQTVKSIEEINLAGIKEAREKAEYERLRAKFEEAK